MCRCFITLLLLLASGHSSAEEVFQRPEDFVREVFRDVAPPPKVLWLTKALRTDVQRIMGQQLPVLRIRYWGHESRTAWILEAVGKEQPITVGFVVNGGRIERMKVLIYRESRGSEVRHPFFTDQFEGATLQPDRQLDRPIHGISGATLSVRALKRLSRLALYLHDASGTKHGQ